MSKIRLNVADSIVLGKQISFITPCDSTTTDGLIINDVEYTICDAKNNNLGGTEGLWASNALVSVLINTETKRAYIQNPAIPEGDVPPVIVGIDDSTIGDKAWSSKNLLDVLCPSTKKSAIMRTLKFSDALPGYPFTRVEMQFNRKYPAGSATPDNIIPVGMDTDYLWKCGSNLLDTEKFTSQSWSKNGVTAIKENNGSFAVSGTCTGSTYCTIGELTLPAGTYTFCIGEATGVYGRLYDKTEGDVELTKTNKPTAGSEFVFTLKKETKLVARLGFMSGESCSGNAEPKIEVGNRATGFTKFIGVRDYYSTGILQKYPAFGAGTFELTSGKLTITSIKRVLTGEEDWASYSSNANCYRFKLAVKGLLSYSTGECSHFTWKDTDPADSTLNDVCGICTIGAAGEYFGIYSSRFKTVAELKKYLSDQNAAGTPVTIIYPVYTTTVTLPSVEIVPEGEVFCHPHGALVIEGYQDAKAMIQKLTNAVISLGGNV